MKVLIPLTEILGVENDAPSLTGSTNSVFGITNHDSIKLEPHLKINSSTAGV